MTASARYVKLFLMQCKLSIMSAAIYRANFWLMLIQSVINSLMGIMCVEFIYGSVESIGGWGRSEMLMLICTAQIVNQLFRGIVHFNQNGFVASVGSGGFDRALTRPVGLMFQVSTGRVDVSCPMSALCPLIVLITQASASGAKIGAANAALFVLFVMNGVVTLSAFMLLIYTTVFVFIKVDGLNNIYYQIMDVAEKPKEMFPRQALYGFVFVLPAIPLANAPVAALLGRASAPLLLSSLAACALFVTASYAALRAGLRRYSSASG